MVCYRYEKEKENRKGSYKMKGDSCAEEDFGLGNIFILHSTQYKETKCHTADIKD